MSKDKSFHKFITIWLGELISCIGSGLTAFALGVYVFQMTHTASGVAMVTLCAFLPSILLAPAGGVLADRFDRRVMMMLGDFFSAIGLIIMMIILAFGKLTVWQICLCVMLSSVFTALMEPAYKATVTDLLTEEEFAKASGLVQVASSAKYLVSPILAGLLLRFTDLRAILLIDISTFVVTVLTTLTVKKNIRSVPVNRIKKKLSAELKEGWSAVVSDRGVFLLVLLMSGVTFYIGFLQTLLTPMVLPLTDTGTLGTIVSISAVGMLVGSLLIGILGIKRKYTAVLCAGLIIAGTGFALMGLTTNLIFITGAGIMFFGALPFINTGADVLIRKNIANEVQGRAWGIISIISQLGYILAYAFSGVAADRIFSPLLKTDGPLAPTVGTLIGTGDGRGIGFMFLLLGILVMGLAVIVYRIKAIRALESRHLCECEA